MLWDTALRWDWDAILMLNAILIYFWETIRGLLRPLESLVAPLGNLLGGPQGSEGVILVILSAPGSILGPLVTILRPLEGVLGASWRGLGGILEAFCELWGGVWRPFQGLASIIEGICENVEKP